MTAPTPRTRRQTLAAAGTLGIAALGAGFGRTLSTARPVGPDLRLDFRIDADPEGPTTDHGVGSDSGSGTSGPSTPRPTSMPPANTGSRRRGGGFLSGAMSPSGGGAGESGEPTTGDGTASVVATPPLSLGGVLPGDGGAVTATLTVADTAAGLWLRPSVNEDENGRIEPERAVDGDGMGDLADAVAVLLWLDGDDWALYERSLAGLTALASGALVADCLPVGRHVVRLRWSLPATATNAVQTDAVSVGLDFAATAYGGANPFA